MDWLETHGGFTLDAAGKVVLADPTPRPRKYKSDVCVFRGPDRLLRDSHGRAVVCLGQFPGCEELRPDFTASVLGWGREGNLVVSAPILDDVLAYVESQFGGVAIDADSIANPRGWPAPAWR